MTTAKISRKDLKPFGIILAIIIMIAGMIGCSGSDGEDAGAAAGTKPTRARPASAQGEKAEAADADAPKGGWIKRAYFSPYYDSVNGKSLKINVETTIPKNDDHYYIFHYWKNFTKVAEKQEEDNIIPYTSFKTGDYIYVDVLLYRDGELLEKKRSAGMLVKNTAPVIEEVTIPDIDGPGTYIIPVKAKDPEGDKLSFSLEGSGSPLFKGLAIDAGTGKITCTMDAEPPPRVMKFIIIVKDEKGGITKKDVSISFKINTPKESGGLP